MSNKPVKPKNGIVLMLDALGARDFTIEEAEAFIEQRDKLISKMNEYIDESVTHAEQVNIILEKGFEVYLQKIADESDNLNYDEYKVEKPKVITFGDTIMLTWETPKKAENAYIFHLQSYLSKIMPYGIKNKLLFRGALSCGEYIESESKESTTILGPAIRDAVSWYEEAQWIGIVATPQCGFIIDNACNMFPQFYGRVWNKYNVKIKNGAEKELWCVDWYNEWLSLTKTKIDLVSLLRGPVEVFGEMSIPKGTEDKYYNTLEYYKWCSEKENNKKLAEIVLKSFQENNEPPI